MYVLVVIAVIYKFVFAFTSKLLKRKDFLESSNKSKILVLFPVYGEDKIVYHSIVSFLNQTYPKDLFSVVLIADHFSEEGLFHLKSLPIKVIDVNFENSSKAKALNYAVDSINQDEFEIVVVLDADNLVDTSFLNSINNAYQSGCMVIQAHRISYDVTTSVAVLDAINEEINNSIYRKGHNSIGLSSALIGSGMAFHAKSFFTNVKHIKTVGEDKELECLYHKENIYIHYLDDVFVYDKKVATVGGFYKQRRRWLSAQIYMFRFVVKDLIINLFRGNIDYVDKIFQWSLLPSSYIIAIIFVSLFASYFVEFILFEKWFYLFIIFVLSQILALPLKFYNIKTFKALLCLPLLIFLMFLNIFRIKEGFNHFIRTRH